MSSLFSHHPNKKGISSPTDTCFSDIQNPQNGTFTKPSSGKDRAETVTGISVVIIFPLVVQCA